MSIARFLLLGGGAVNALALDSRPTLRGSMEGAMTAEESLGYDFRRCSNGLFKEPNPLADMHSLWKPFNDSEAHTGVAVYVQFSKVGSESMRCTMWEGVEGLRDTCFPHSGFRYRSGKPLPRLKHRHVVQGRYGLCESPKTRGMICSYFTLLRDPVDTALSMYTYFCQHCAEGGRFCKSPNVVAPGGAKCPQMSFVDFTRINGNVYVKEFSGAYGCADCGAAGAGEPQLDADGSVVCKPFEEACGSFRSTVSNLTEHDAELLERAKINIEREVIPITLDEFYVADGQHPAGTEVLSMAYGWTGLTPHYATHTYSQEGHFEPTDGEIAEVRKLLAPDLALYEHARTVFHSAGDWLRAQHLTGDPKTLQALAQHKVWLSERSD